MPLASSVTVGFCFRESENLRSIERLRLEGTSVDHLVQISCSVKTTQSMMPRTMSMWLSKISLEEIFHTLSGKSVLFHPHSTEVLPGVQTEHSVVQFVSTASCPSTGHHWREPASILFVPSIVDSHCILVPLVVPPKVQFAILPAVLHEVPVSSSLQSLPLSLDV